MQEILHPYYKKATHLLFLGEEEASRVQEDRMKDFEKQQKLEIELVKAKGELEKMTEKKQHVTNEVTNLKKEVEKVKTLIDFKSYIQHFTTSLMPDTAFNFSLTA